MLINELDNGNIFFYFENKEAPSHALLTNGGNLILLNTINSFNFREFHNEIKENPYKKDLYEIMKKLDLPNTKNIHLLLEELRNRVIRNIFPKYYFFKEE